MKKKRKEYRVHHPAGGYDHVSSSSEFYSASPTERPLADSKGPSDFPDVRKTKRHHTAPGRGVQKMDPRERMALIAILKLIVLILSLVFAFFLLRKGISLYEESIWINNAESAETSPILEEVELIGSFDIQDQDSREQFAERVELWKEAERLVRSADVLMQRNINDQAIIQCQEALRRDPAHIGALERLGKLYYAEGSHVEAVNAYIRLLSVDPSRNDTKKRLIKSLDACGDHQAVRYMAEWYLDETPFDAEVQQYLADVYYDEEQYAEAAEAYGKVLQALPKEREALERQASAYMHLKQFDKALVPLEKLREIEYTNPMHGRNIAICQAQMERAKDSVQTLIRMAQQFGQPIVLGWLKDPQFDPVREERVFQGFVDRVGGENFRMELEKLAREAQAPDETIEPQLRVTTPEGIYRDEAILER